MSRAEFAAMAYAVKERQPYWDAGVTCVDTENYYPDILLAYLAGAKALLEWAKSHKTDFCAGHGDSMPGVWLEDLEAYFAEQSK